MLRLQGQKNGKLSSKFGYLFQKYNPFTTRDKEVSLNDFADSSSKHALSLKTGRSCNLQL